MRLAMEYIRGTHQEVEKNVGRRAEGAVSAHVNKLLEASAPRPGVHHVAAGAAGHEPLELAAGRHEVS